MQLILTAYNSNSQIKNVNQNHFVSIQDIDCVNEKYNVIYNMIGINISIFYTNNYYIIQQVFLVRNVSVTKI